MSVRNLNWYALNGTRRWPVDDAATGEADDGAALRNDILVDAAVRLPADLCALVAVSSVTVTANLVTVTLVGVTAHPAAPAGVSVGDQRFVPVGVVSVRKPVAAGRPYPIRPLADGVGGWLVFGDGLGRPARYRFSTPGQAVLAPRACRFYRRLPVTSIGKRFDAAALTGVVAVRGGTDVEVAAAVREVAGVERDVIVVRLQANTPRNLFDAYRGPCGGRPESRTCNRDGVEYLNTVGPDCDGDVRIEFPSPLRASYYPGGVALDYPYGLIDACTRNDRLPAPTGHLPNEYPDECGPQSSAGDPDANAGRGPPVAAGGGGSAFPAEMSSEAVEPAALPVTLYFDAGWDAVRPAAGAWTLAPTDSPLEPPYQVVVSTPYTAYDEVRWAIPYVVHVPRPPQPTTDCALCPDGGPGEYQFSFTGGTGDFAGFAGRSFTAVPDGACNWSFTDGDFWGQGTWVNIGGGERQLQGQVIYSPGGVFTSFVGFGGTTTTGTVVGGDCCAPMTVPPDQYSDWTGTGDLPQLDVTTAGPCSPTAWSSTSSETVSAVSSESSLVPREAVSSEIVETTGPDQAIATADLAARNIALWAGSIGLGSAGVKLTTDLTIGRGAGVAGLLFNYRGAVAGGFQYWAVELSRASSQLQIRHWNGLAWIVLVSAGPLVVAADRWYKLEGGVLDLGGGAYRLTARAWDPDGGLLAAITTDLGDYGPPDGYLGFVADRTLAAYSYLRVEANP